MNIRDLILKMSELTDELADTDVAVVWCKKDGSLKLYGEDVKNVVERSTVLKEHEVLATETEQGQSKEIVTLDIHKEWKDNV